MSAVIKKARKQYGIAYTVECFILVVTSVFLGMLTWQIAFSFAIGALLVFIPNCLFLWVVFFVNHQGKPVNFYKGEFVKFAVTVILTIMALYCFDIHTVAFFSGFFFIVLFNAFLPFIIEIFFKQHKLTM